MGPGVNWKYPIEDLSMTAFLSWYIVVQLISILTLPLAYQLFQNLPDRGYIVSKSLGILLVGFTLWIGTSYGLLRNEAGGAWLAFVVVSGFSCKIGWAVLKHDSNQGFRLLNHVRQNWAVILVAELLFLITFGGWTIVRAHDPGITHTEQPMDLMFMNGIWNSATYPPQDPWLSGYAISYYYFGYWLLVTLGRLSNQPPEIAYNVGQACWYSLLLLGCFGVGYNLLALQESGSRQKKGVHAQKITAVLGGMLAMLAVGVDGNLEGILEWLYAQGIHIDRLSQWFHVHEFPGRAAITNRWFISYDGWWWRSSRIIQDYDLFNRRIDASPITETPIFSFILGDNHPHVLALPFILLVISLALNLFLAGEKSNWTIASAIPTTHSATASWRRSFLIIIPQNLSGFFITVIAVGALIFLNTWDFPPYWLLLSLAFVYATHRIVPDRFFILSILFSISIFISAGLLFFPYLLTAQSQAAGFIPNLFHPTYFPQFLLIFGPHLLGVLTLIYLAWQEARPTCIRLIITYAATLGLPIVFLLLSGYWAINTAGGARVLEIVTLPENAQGYLPFIKERWTAQPWTFIVIGVLLATTIAICWQLYLNNEIILQPSFVFILTVAGIGLMLIFVPEFIYLRDHFGTRMNTIFKFYYQGWLLLGLCSAYSAVIALRGNKLEILLGGLILSSIAINLIYPIAGIYSKTNGFQAQSPTVNGIQYIEDIAPDEWAAITWIKENTAPNALIVEALGNSYWSTHNRISTITGHPTLVGWDGHESQWRGKDYAEMAEGRDMALKKIYRNGSRREIIDILARWNISYVYIGPIEREKYQFDMASERRLQQAMDLAFESGSVQIYKRRG